MKLVRPSSNRSIDALLSESAVAMPTYSEVGATLRGEQPQRFRHDTCRAKLGVGRHVFLRASTALQNWESHNVSGADVFPQSTPIELGLTVLVTLGTPWLAVAAPCRIVGVVDEPNRWGFAYGTLPGHPEQGEESFVVSIDDDEVTFTITAFSRAGNRIVEFAGPIGRAMQRVGTRGYVKALKGAVDRAD